MSEQHLHCLPSVYGWFSYVVPFGLAVHPAATAAPLLAVAAVGAASLWATGALEDAIVNWASASRMRDTQLDAIFASYNKKENDRLGVWEMRELLTDLKRTILDEPTTVVSKELLDTVMRACRCSEGGGETAVPRDAALRAIKRCKALLFRRERQRGVPTPVIMDAFARGELQSFLREGRAS